MIAFLKGHDIERLHGVTWSELLELEPELALLWWQARQAGAGCRRWADVSWVFALYRQNLAELVGLDGKNRQHPILGTVGAYDVAYWRLFDAVARMMILQDCQEETADPAPAPPHKVGATRTARAC